MEKSRLVLKDGTAITLEAGSSLGVLRTIYADMEALAADWDKFTPENLSEVEIKDGETVTGSYRDLTFASPALQADAKEDGSLAAAWGLREKTELEKLKDRVAAVEETTDILTMDALMGGNEA